MRLEKLLHGLLAELKIRNELFHHDWRILQFAHHVELEGIARGLRFLEDTTPKRLQVRKEEDRIARIKAVRQSKAEKDAYFASLVASRKERIGW
jgi:hypothetical protein